MKFLFRLLICLASVILFSHSISFSQSPSEGNHILWRITGKGIKGQSYLFGTIHVTDKRVFNFGDSLYAAIEKSDGYAMELDPDSLVSEILNNAEEKEASILVKDVADKKLFEKVKKNLEQKLKRPANKITVKEVREYYKEWSGLFDPNKGMETVMDTYLYNAVKNAGKWTGGIEDVADQLEMMEEIKIDEYLEGLFEKDEESRKLIEKMVRIYETENLSEMEAFDGISEIKSPTMLKRNVKMARRMDSLSAIRSTFFAVGAGHLPGDSGVVALLRKRGFTVEPVISSKKIHALNYKFTQKLLPWVQVKSDSGYYSAQFPAKPQNNKTELNRETKMYVDLGSNLFYMTMVYINEEVKDEGDLYKNIINDMVGKDTLVSKKDIEQQGLKGKEVLIGQKDLYMRVRLFYFAPAIYSVTVGSEVKRTLNSDDVERFLAGFIINKDKKPVFNNNWRKYEYERNGFVVEFPAKPKIKIGNTENKDGFISDHYDMYDEEKDCYYQVVVKSATRGNYVTKDSAAFAEYVTNIANRDKIKIIRQKQFNYNGYPAIEIEFTNVIENSIIRSKLLYFHRGNRLYIASATFNDDSKSLKLAEKFISNFQITAIKESNWRLQLDPEKSFQAWAADPITLLEDSAGIYQIPGQQMIYAFYDSSAASTLFISKAVYPRFFWAQNDTSLIRKESNDLIHYRDSLIDYKWVRNGNYKGAEIIIKPYDNNNLKKFRLILVGDTLYSIYTIAAQEWLQRESYRRFFEDFRFIDEKAVSTIFKRKTADFLTALKTADSAALVKLKPVLSLVEFENEDLPLLYEALLQPYADSGTYNSVTSQLFTIIGQIKSKSTIDFVNKTYRDLPKRQEELRYELLNLLAAQETQEAYHLISDLLKFKSPEFDNPYRLFSRMRDTLQLTVQIFPDLLHLLKDPYAGAPLIQLTNYLLDSSLIQKSILDKYKTELNSLAEQGVKETRKKDNENSYQYYSLIGLFGKLNTKETEQWLRKFLSSEEIYIKYHAAVTLLENKLTVGSADLLKLAASNDYRISLYEKLKELKKESLFPITYKTQKAFAESELYLIATEGYEVDVNKISFIGEKIASYQGKKQKFYLFKVIIEVGDGRESRLGIMGPYGLKPQPLVTESDVSGMYMDEEFNLGKLDSHLKEFLLQREAEE